MNWDFKAALSSFSTLNDEFKNPFYNSLTCHGENGTPAIGRYNLGRHSLTRRRQRLTPTSTPLPGYKKLAHCMFVCCMAEAPKKPKKTLEEARRRQSSWVRQRQKEDGQGNQSYIVLHLASRGRCVNSRGAVLPNTGQSIVKMILKQSF